MNKEEQNLLMGNAFGNYDINYYITKHNINEENEKLPTETPIEISHNITKNVFVVLTPGSELSNTASLKYISPDEAGKIMNNGYKLLWKHCKDIGTTYYDPVTGEVKFYPYIPLKENEKNS